MILRINSFIVLLFLTLGTCLLGQTDLNPIEQKLLEYETNFEGLTPVSLFTLSSEQSAQAHYAKEVSEARFYERNEEWLSQILINKPQFLKLNLPQEEGTNMEIWLYEAPIFSEGYMIELSSENESVNQQELGLHYWGAVQGTENSLVTISIAPEEVMGLVLADGLQFTLGKLQKSDTHIFYETADLLVESLWECGTDGSYEVGSGEKSGKATVKAGVLPPSNCVGLYVEVDNDIVVNKGGVGPATNYVNGLFSQVIILYANEAVNVTIDQLFVWSTVDPYTATNPSSLLTQFRNYLNGNYNGDLAHLVSLAAPGGVAYVDVLCNSYYGVAYSGIYTSYNNVPTYSWSVEVVTHEMGHNLGSRHTHDCVWGPQNNTPIDCCGQNAGYSSNSCGSGYNCTVPNPPSGTIMSYCHLLGGVGINFNNGFGTEPGDKIRSEVYNASCLTSCATGPCAGAGGDNDGDGSCANADCDDNDAAVYPGATEICDGKDNDCDGSVDEGLTSTYYRDFDGDGYGNPGNTTQACSQPNGYTTNNTDCNDNNSNVYPGATEVCDGLDNDCDGSVDEGVLSTYYRDLDGDGYGNANVTTQACSQPNGYVSNTTDCNDNNANVNPGAIEVCDGLDNDCDGSIDEGVLNTYYVDGDGDGYGVPGSTVQACSPPSGYANNSTDCNDTNANVNPGATEVCDGLDNDCDGSVDEGVLNTYYVDSDGDGYGVPGSTMQACSQPNGYAPNNTDCDDNNTTVYPGAPELCDGLDNDCDGTIDPDTDGDGTPDCNDGCPLDPNKITPGVCGCGTPDIDTDGDGTLDCNDGCPLDPLKIAPGVCGCGTPDTDTDGDGTPDCNDGCPLDPLKTAPGVCGCGTPDTDTDGDGTPDCNDLCPNEPLRISPADFYADTDGDGYGNPTSSINVCTPPAGYVSDDTDCNDGNAAINPGASETCGDGIDNNCNGQVDENCGGCTYGQIDFNNFESGWGLWNDGGSDCRRGRRDANYALGTYCARLRDNTSSSVMTTDNIDLSNYDEVTVDFSYYPRSMDNSNEDFWLQISTNGGGSYTIVEEWNTNDEFVNDQRYYDTVVIPGPFTATTRLRFRCDASGNSDWVYIDEVMISGCLQAGARPANNGDSKKLLELVDARDLNDEIMEITEMKLYPNPATKEINLSFKHGLEERANIQIFDLNGKVWKTVEQESISKDANMIINLDGMPQGNYFLRLSVGEELEVAKFLIM